MRELIILTHHPRLLAAKAKILNFRFPLRSFRFAGRKNAAENLTRQRRIRSQKQQQTHARYDRNAYAPRLEAKLAEVGFQIFREQVRMM